MKRRAFIAGLAGAAAWPRMARGQKSNPAIGELSINPTGEGQAAFEQGLAGFGYMVGQNISLVVKNATGDPDRLNQLAAELLAARVDVIYAPGSEPTSVLKHLNTNIPIVTISTNPVGLGFASSLARPGGNITGLSLLGPEVAGKRLQLLKELIPEVAKAAVLWNPDDPGARFSLAETQAASKALIIDLHPVETRTTADIDGAFAAAAKDADQAVIVLPAPLLGRNAGRIADLALANRLPTFGFRKAEAKIGQLLSFGPNIPATARRAAYFVHRILKGASPSDLPIEQPTKFDLVINLSTAKALGITVPNSVLVRADEVIE